MKRQILSLLALALLAGCARAPSSTLRENANGFTVRMDTAWVRRMETLDKARSLLLGFQGLRDARALGLAPQREDREGRDRAEDLGRSLDSLRRLHATSRWCLLCGTAADSTVEITVWLEKPKAQGVTDAGASPGNLSGRKRIATETFWRTDLPRSTAIDRTLLRRESREPWERMARPMDFLDADRYLSDARGGPNVWKSPPHSGLWSRYPVPPARFLLTPLWSPTRGDEIRVEGWIKEDTSRLWWRRSVPMNRDTLHCDGDSSVRLCLQLERRQPVDPAYGAVRLPESAPFPDSLASCYGVAGQEMDGWLKHTRKEFSGTTIPWRGIHLGGWSAWGEVTSQRILHATWPKLPEDTAALVLEAPSFCRLEQLIARVPDAQCTHVSDGGSLQLGLLGGLEGGPERINCTFNDDGYPRGVLEDWMEIHELVNHAYCLKEKSADQCPVPKRRIP